MKLDGLNEQSSMNSVLYHDNSALMNIKNSNEQGAALETVAGQFEAMFLQLVLRQMRSSSDVLADDDSPFSSQQQGVFRDMYDGQLAIEMSKKQHSGISEMLIKQLSPSISEVAFSASESTLPANDTLSEVEASSHAEASVAPNSAPALHSSQESVASVRQMLGEAGVTTAFAQPLIRKMEL
ncbi:rod-binding protein [Vibrio sp. Isolate25]|uniref:rod-binding protein n=1 Tax=unclassified Vibrio TaxID=2614977 RepID=UPI001EFD1861|nr:MULTISPECIES: rod-binding protein [unclassified Vibrio]MCG9597160.1 rod-binding protein [Vibrio sp. Isolate25]MCG9684110.1 rod-binding protein [Vibrio sp. Isolate23]